MPIGIAIGKMRSDSMMEIELDYTIPSYRDFSAGKFLYNYLSEKWGISKILFTGKMDANDAYLKKMNFIKTDTGFIKNI